MSQILNGQKKKAVKEFLQMNNFAFNEEFSARKLIENFIKKRNIEIENDKDLKRSYDEFNERNSYVYRDFLNKLNETIISKEENISDKKEISNLSDLKREKEKKIILGNILKNNQEITIYLKNSSANADSKCGWMITFFALAVSALVALGINFNNWIIFGPITSLPVISILILAIQMVTHHDEKEIDVHFIERSESIQSLNKFEIKKAYRNSLNIGALISKVEKVITKKEMWISIAFGISLPILIPFIIKRYKTKNNS